MMSLYKTLVRAYVEYCSSAWSPLYKKRSGVDRKNSAQIYKGDKNMEGKSYDDRLRYLGFFVDSRGEKK